MRSRILLGTLFGAIGGFTGYFLQEVTVTHDAVLATPAREMMRLGFLVGSMLGIAIGIVEGAAVGSARRLLTGGIIGGVIGALGGIFGIYFGSALYSFALFGKDPNTLSSGGNIFDFTHQVLARALGWSLLGALPGLAAGAATFSRKRAMHGLIGGLLGGFLGGFAFDLVASLITNPVTGAAAASAGQTTIEIGGPSRAIGFTLIGAFTGLFIGLVEELLKQGWVRVLAGKNEGRDYILSKPLTVLGRDERADVPLYGDPNVAAQHAAIKLEGGRHILLKGPTPPAVVVNGQAVQDQQLLRDGDMIQIGQIRIAFHEKATANRVGRAPVDVQKAAAAGSAVQVPADHCQFCGAKRDASGGCLCSVSSAGMPMPTPQMSQFDPGGGYPPPQPTGYGPPTAFGQSGPPTGYGPPTAFGQTGSLLKAQDGPYAGHTFPLSGPSVSIGRDPGNDVALNSDSTISRRHARIVDEGGRHVVYDDGSSNGTFVNSVRVQVQTLAPGDIIQFGSSTFRYD